MCFFTDGSESQSKFQTSQKPENSWVILQRKIPKGPRDDSSIIFPKMGDLFESLGKGGIQWRLLSHWQVLLSPLASPQGRSCSADVSSPVLGQEQFESKDLFHFSNPNARIDWWMDGWWLNRWKKGKMDEQRDGWMEGRKKVKMDDGWMAGLKEGWMDVTESWCEDIWGILYWNLRDLGSSPRFPLLLLAWCLWFFLGTLFFQSCLGTQVLGYFCQASYISLTSEGNFLCLIFCAQSMVI